MRNTDTVPSVPNDWVRSFWKVNIPETYKIRTTKGSFLLFCLGFIWPGFQGSIDFEHSQQCGQQRMNLSLRNNLEYRNSLERGKNICNENSCLYYYISVKRWNLTSLIQMDIIFFINKIFNIFFITILIQWEKGNECCFPRPMRN